MLAPVTAGTQRRWIPGGSDEIAHDADGHARGDASGWAAPVRATLVSLIAVAFLLGWTSGVLVVWKTWQLCHASRWIMVSGAGYVTLMLIPIMCGFVCARVAGHLASRGWSGAPLRTLALGVCGLVAGLMAI
jgi:hypothetical protein